MMNAKNLIYTVCIENLSLLSSLCIKYEKETKGITEYTFVIMCKKRLTYFFLNVLN